MRSFSPDGAGKADPPRTRFVLFWVRGGTRVEEETAAQIGICAPALSSMHPGDLARWKFQIRRGEEALSESFAREIELSDGWRGRKRRFIFKPCANVREGGAG